MRKEYRLAVVKDEDPFGIPYLVGGKQEGFVKLQVWRGVMRNGEKPWEDIPIVFLGADGEEVNG